MSGTRETIKPLRTAKREEDIRGVWRLSYKLTNRMGAGGFSGRMLSSYPDPLSGMPRHLYDLNGNQMPGYFIEKQITILKPDESVMDRNVVDWLLGHPLVKIQKEHANLTEEHVAKKESNSRIELLNLDYEEVVELEDEDYIDKLVGRLSLDNGVQSIGLEKLRYILAALNMPYMERKYITNKHIEKQKLRKRLKNYARKGIDYAKDINDIIDNLEAAQLEYEIKELKRLGLIYVAGGMYKYNSVPLGTSIDSVIKYFRENPDFYTEISEKLYKKLKEEIDNA